MLVSTPVTKPISRCHQLLKMQKNFAIRGRGRRAALLSQARCAWPRHTVPTPLGATLPSIARAEQTPLQRSHRPDRAATQRSVKPFNPANPVVSDVVSLPEDGWEARRG